MSSEYCEKIYLVRMASYDEGDSICCRYHPYAYLIDDWKAGDQICSECGLVVQERVIDVAAEWRTFSKDNDSYAYDRSRVGGRESYLLDDSLLTAIGTGRGATSPSVPKYINHMSVADRTMIIAMKEIGKIADKIHLPRVVIDRANHAFKKFLKKNVVKGKSIAPLSAACLFLACRQEHSARSFKEIGAVSNTSAKEIFRYYKELLNMSEASGTVAKTEDYMPRFCGSLGLPREIEKAASYIVERVNQLSCVKGKTPLSITATAIYMASQASADKKNMKQIGNVTGVSELTIRLCLKQMLPHAEKLFPTDFEFITQINQLPKT